MLLSSRGRTYICWRCVSLQHQAVVRLPTRQRRSLNHNSYGANAPDTELSPLRHHNALKSDHAPKNGAPAARLPGKAPPKLPIREELRQWAISDGAPTIASRPLDVSLATRINNTLTRTQSQLFALDEGGTIGGDLGDVFGAGQDEAVGAVGAGERQVGDLVELTTAISRNGTLAIYLGYFSGRYHFYSHDSRWLMSSGFPAVFSVAKFATEEEINLVLRAIPHNLPVEVYQQMQKENKGPSRSDGATLLKKMRDFRLESELIHQNNIKSLDAARDHLAHETEVRQMSLFNITDILLPQARKDDGSFSASALYSVLTALRREDIAFRPLSPSRDCHRQDYMFEVISKAQVASISRAVRAVRQFNFHTAQSEGVLDEKHTSSAIGIFVKKARETVNLSRAVRGWTPHGILEPSNGLELPEPDWRNSNIDILNFLEWWANYDLFNASSRYHSYGSTILRATGLYGDAPLDQRTAWTFLQELGYIDSREIPSRFKIRLPGTTFTKGGGLKRATLERQAIEGSKQPDVAAAMRVETDAPVFCIDDPSTVIIDDGLSLERTENPEEFWIHIHVADPASRIAAQSDLAKFLELIPENIYLPGHFEAMIPAQIGQDPDVPETKTLLQELSLHPGSQALTFSAKVNSAGEILDYRIKPSTLNKVSYLDPTDVASFCGDSDAMPVPDTKLSVGGPFPQQTYGEPRDMTTPEQLEQSGQDDLRTLHTLARALRSKRLAQGAWPIFLPRPSVSVRHDPKSRTSAPEVTDGGAADKLLRIPADPQIEVQYQTSEGNMLVASTMVLAGQIAARWCSERGIPIPFRRDTASAQNYDQALAYATEKIYPLIRRGVEPGREHRGILSTLVGGVQLSTTPGPYFILGIDKYAKVTSPLRRFGDLIAHWQIHAALAHEFKTGEKITPSVVNDIVPFPEEELKGTLTLLQMREKMIRKISEGSQDWILIAIARAWHAADGSVPATMRFTVNSRGTAGLLGQLDYFDLPASMEAVQIDGKVLIQDVRVGDQLTVELDDINVYEGTITVKALEYLGRTKDSPPSPINDIDQQIPAGAREKGFGIFSPGDVSSASL